MQHKKVMTLAKKITPTFKGLSPKNIRELYPEFSALLQKRQNEIMGRSDQTRTQIDEQILTSPGDVGDASVVDESADYFLNLADSQRRELLEIQEALDRMHRGVYGVCESCGEDIAAERLRRLPFARLCIDCQSSVEARQKSGRLNPMPKL